MVAFKRGFGISVEGLFGFDRGAVVEFGVNALDVPPLRPFQGCEFDLLVGAPSPWARTSSVLKRALMASAKAL